MSDDILDSKYAVETFNLTKHFGKGDQFVKAVDGIDLKVEKGSIHGFIGPNGAGKTTSMMMLIGSIFPTAGTGKIFGHPMGDKISKKLIGFGPAHPSFYDNMSAFEYLRFMGRISGMPKKDTANRAKELLSWMNLTDAGHRNPTKFSTGMKAKLCLAQALMHSPPLAILDEVTAGMDPEGRRTVIEDIRNLAKEEGTTILISSHILGEVEKMIDHVSIIVGGKIGLDGGINEIREEFSANQFILKASHGINAALDLEQKGIISIQSQSEKQVLFRAENEIALFSELPKVLTTFNSTLFEFRRLEVTLESVFMRVTEGKYDHEAMEVNK